MKKINLKIKRIIRLVNSSQILIHLLAAYFIVIFISCNYKKANIQYDRVTHIINDLSKNTIRNLVISERNILGSNACSINIYKKSNLPGESFVNLQNPDTIHYSVDNSLKCKFKNNNHYILHIEFLDQKDSLEIVW